MTVVLEGPAFAQEVPVDVGVQASRDGRGHVGHDGVEGVVS